MAYFDQVYLKMLNKDGRTIQQRIQTKKEKDFGVFLYKSPNKVKVYKDARTYYGVLQNTENSEKEVISYLLTFKDNVWENGTIITTENEIDLSKQNWLILHLDNFVSIGYNRYTVIELDNEIEWINDGIIYSELVHFTGSGANLRDKSITSKFIISFNVAAVYEPNKILNLVMKTNANMQKGVRLIINDETWKVSGIDKTSVKGVSYITLEEDYNNKEEDIEYADSSKLLKWDIQSSLGDFIKLKLNEETGIDFFLYYGNEKRFEPMKVEVIDSNLLNYNNNLITGVSVGDTSFRVSLLNAPEVYKDFKVNISENEAYNLSIIGPDNIKLGDVKTYQFISDLPIEELTISSEKGFFEITDINEETIIISAIKIGKDKLCIYNGASILYNKEIEIKSLWME